MRCDGLRPTKPADEGAAGLQWQRRAGKTRSRTRRRLGIEFVLCGDFPRKAAKSSKWDSTRTGRGGRSGGAESFDVLELELCHEMANHLDKNNAVATGINI